MSRSARDRSYAGHLALVVGHPASTGGMETFCRFLAETMLDAGWRVSVALSCENVYHKLQTQYGEGLDVEQANWIDATCAGDRNYAWSTIDGRRRWFRQVQPNVAVVVQSSNTPFRCAVAGARLAGVPVVVTHRTMAWPVEESPSRRHLLGLLPGLGLHRRRVMCKTWLVGRLADRIVYNSDAVRHGYEELYCYPANRGVVIRNAVQAGNVLDRGRAGSPSVEELVTIGFVGRIGADKRLDVLLHAVAKMQTRAVRVALYGEGAERSKLESLAAELGIADRIEWRGETQDAAAAYDDMDIVVLCSHRESSSNMVLEAMAAGKAAVVTEAGGSPELVGYGECGVCVPALDVDALTRALDELTVSSECRRLLGERARARAVAEHDPRQISEQWVSLLSEVAGVARVKPARVLGKCEEPSLASTTANLRLRAGRADGLVFSARRCR